MIGSFLVKSCGENLETFLWFYHFLSLFGPTAGRYDPPDADLADPADAAGKRPAGRGRGVGEAEPDEAGVVHCRIPDIPDHADQV